MPTYTQLLEQAQALRDSPAALTSYLWQSERVFTDALAARLDALVPGWRELMGPLLPLLWMGRAGEVDHWLDLEALALTALTLPQRQRLARALKRPEHHEAIAKLLTPTALAQCIDELYAQWVEAKRPRQARWLQPLCISHGSLTQRVSLQRAIWQKGHAPHQRLELLHELLNRQDPSAHHIAQLVSYYHPLPALRAAARAHNQRWADAAKLSLMGWADAVAGQWQPIEPEEIARLEQLTTRRLDLAIRAQHAWSISELREVICSGHPLAQTLRSLIWANERGQWCMLDERAQPRNTHDEAIPARQLTLAHPIDAQTPALERWRLRCQGLVAPIQQLKRAVFTAEMLIEHEDSWYRPSWPERLRPFTIMRYLRHKKGWEFTAPEDNGAIAGLSLFDERSDQTVLVQLIGRADRPRYGQAFSTGAHQDEPDYPIDWGLILLKGQWDRQRLGWSYKWPPNFPAYGILRSDISPLRAADTLFLSEVLRDLHLASR